MHASGARFHVVAVKANVDLGAASSRAELGGGSLRQVDDFEGARWSGAELVGAGVDPRSAERSGAP